MRLGSVLFGSVRIPKLTICIAFLNNNEIKFWHVALGFSCLLSALLFTIYFFQIFIIALLCMWNVGGIILSFWPRPAFSAVLN